MVRTGWLGLAAAGLAAVAWAAAAYGGRRWNRSTDGLLRRIEAQRLHTATTRFDARELAGLPAPVQRYFRTVLGDGQRMVVSATLAHSGTFNIGIGGDQWKPFRSSQHVVTRRPGFVWDARIQMWPGVTICVHDAYVAGAGLLCATLLGLFTLAEQHGQGDELAHGELMRFLAEAAWYPTALLPSQGVTWEAVDADSARATLSDGALRASLLFRFDAQGLIESVHADARGRTIGREIVMTPWEGRWSDYQERNGMRVPIVGEVAWLSPEGRVAYWRGRLTSLEHET